MSFASVTSDNPDLDLRLDGNGTFASTADGMSATTKHEWTVQLPRLVTIPEAAAALAVSRATVYELIADGELPALRLRPHGHVRIVESDLAALVERRRAEGATW